MKKIIRKHYTGRCSKCGRMESICNCIGYFPEYKEKVIEVEDDYKIKEEERAFKEGEEK